MRDNRVSSIPEPFLLNPEKEKALKEHIQAIALILYEETSPEQLRDLETIETTVRHQVTFRSTDSRCHQWSIGMARDGRLWQE